MATLISVTDPSTNLPIHVNADQIIKVTPNIAAGGGSVIHMVTGEQFPVKDSPVDIAAKANGRANAHAGRG
jgi:hypothetical protein